MKKYKEKLKYVITGRLKNIQITSFHSGLATFLCHFATFRNLISIIRSFRAYISRNKYHHLIEQNQYTTKAIVSVCKNGGIKEVSFNVAHAQNVTLQELNLLEAYLKKHYVFSISSKSDSTSDYLVGIPLWFVKL